MAEKDRYSMPRRREQQVAPETRGWNSFLSRFLASSMSRSIISIFIHPLFLLVTRRTLCGREIVAKIGIKLFQGLSQEVVEYFRDLSLYFGSVYFVKTTCRSFKKLNVLSERSS